MTRRWRSRIVTALGLCVLLALYGWDVVHGRWGHIAWSVGGLVGIVVLFLLINAWVERGES